MRAPAPAPIHIHMSLPLFILSFFALVAVAVAASAHPELQDSSNTTTNRRILHQPLFPVSSAPPPEIESTPAPPITTTPDQPFFHENPPDQTQSPPPPPAAAGEVTGNNTVSHPVAPQPANKPAKKIAVAISVGIVTLGMLSALAFYLYKHKSKHRGESQKLVGAENSQRNNEESSRNMPPSTFLYIGTVEPSRSITEETKEVANGSPYHKLNSIKRSDRYRPSPDLQPLPPLTKPPPPPVVNSPPAMSSSDEESHDFYTPHGSTASTEEGYSIPSSKQSNQSNKKKNSSLVIQVQPRSEARSTSPVPHSKRTSPRSRLSVSSSPDTKNTMSSSSSSTSSSRKLLPATPTLPPPGPPSRPPLAPPSEHGQPLALTYGPRRAKFAAPPPPPDMARLHSVNNQSGQMPNIPVPPPPPPPPPPALSTPQKVSPLQASAASFSQQQSAKPETRSSTPKVIPGIVKRKPMEEADEVDGSKPKLKPLHWDKVRATSDRATVWDQLKSSSFQLNEDMMESLFGCNSAGSAKKEDTRRSVLPPVEQENRVLDPKKSQNIAILLRALNVTRDEVSEALLDGNPESLGTELLETLVKMAPTKEEEIKLRDYRGDSQKLGSAERFLKGILDIPFAFKRVEAMLYRANFDSEVKYLRNSFQTLEAASEELKNSRLFLKLLEAVLRTGNRMNVGTNRGEATAFKLDTLLKLVDIKGTDGKTTLLHFVVQEIIRSEGAGSNPKPEDPPTTTNPRFSEGTFRKQGLQVVGGLSRELSDVKKAAGMDSDVLSGYVAKLEMGLDKVRFAGHEKADMQGNFFQSMKLFLREAEIEIAKIKIDERKALAAVKDVTEYFHGDTAKEGAHPFRIFMIVRDFLGILDHVCKEVGQMQDRTVVGSARSFRIPATASLPVLNRYNVHHSSSSDEESSYSSPRD